MSTPNNDRSERSAPTQRRRPLADFIHDETLGGIALILATSAALIWANLSTSSYEKFWDWTIGPDQLIDLNLSLHAWVNDALMTIFFFVAGMEIKRELVHGELSQPRKAAMPFIGAIGGMALPAAIYLALNSADPGRQGWGIPMATDIAFVLGVLALLGRRAPSGLRLFLLAIAIIDDIGAIVVIALFYSEAIEGRWVLVAIAAVCIVVSMRKVGILRPISYVPIGIAMWVAFHESGVHATIAGVALGLLTPAGVVGNRQVLSELQYRLHPISAFIIVPLFALANAGVVVRSDVLSEAASSPITLGIFIGLVLGKPVGITTAVWIAQRLHFGSLPKGIQFTHVVGGATLAGIGFTVSLFIAELSFGGSKELGYAKIGVLVASVAAGLASWALFEITSRINASDETTR